MTIETNNLETPEVRLTVLQLHSIKDSVQAGRWQVLMRKEGSAGRILRKKKNSGIVVGKGERRASNEP